ncbi:phosphoglycolate phosphatase [Microbacterium resistens]|uniref:Phosphoglycolate phosphatase n=1 Tax=Microbacterium resistens TaxID=156977 RepID=A0ABU1SE93_9MICO|nr:HAD hydrolase-like protein [Microbacterium resistens]MDR6867889.1 phosphoglycolate phosphatase [Microbacterium resistens]
MADSPYSCVLWDVDGTIADASAGILPRLAEVFASYGKPAPPADELSLWIGPPMFESFRDRGGMTTEQAEQAVLRYRELAARDGYAASVAIYPGIPEVMSALADAGIPQATASSKPENQVIAIVEHYDLARFLTVTAGARPDTAGRHDDKATVIRSALDRLIAAGVDVSRPVLIGDRHHDVEGASPFGIPVLFADWGFGEPSEAEGAVAHVATPTDLLPLLLPGS